MNILAEIKGCVLIPIYNNEQTLRRVLDDVLASSQSVIVVNDASTDATSEVLAKYDNLKVIHFDKRRGKGIALREGFKEAYASGYKYAITMNADKWHPESISTLIKDIKKEDSTLLIATRNNRLQNNLIKKLSNFWFWVETGIRLEDTQSIFRLYPLEVVSQVKCLSSRTGFETEIIVKSAWRGVKVQNIPLQPLDDAKEATSHTFSLTKTLTTIVLNTYLVAVGLFYIRPRNFLSSFKKKEIKEFFVKNVLRNDDSKLKKSLSVALGVFIGIMPLWGFQTIVTLFLAVLLRLNKLIAFAFSNISFPPFIPFIIYASLKTGQLFIANEEEVPIDLTDMSTIGSNFKGYMLGSLVLATVSSSVAGGLAYLLFGLAEKRSIRKTTVNRQEINK